MHVPHVRGGVWSMSEDSAGNIWVCTYDAGLYRVSPGGQVRHWSSRNGLSYDGTRFAFEDRERNIWVGTSGGGLMRFKSRQVQAFGAESGLTERVVNSVCADREGTIWVATYGKGLFRFKDGKFENVPLAGPRVRHSMGKACWRIAPGESGSARSGADCGFWISRACARFPTCPAAGITWSAFSRIPRVAFGWETASASRFTTAGRLKASQWIVACPRGKFVAWAKRATVRSGFPIVKGSIAWRGIGSWKYRRPASVRFGRSSASRRSRTARSGWGPRNRGLLRWKEGRLSGIDGSAGLPVTGVYGILEDGQGRFWMPSNRGVVRVSRDDLQAAADGTEPRRNFQILDLSDGLPGIECTSARQPVLRSRCRGKILDCDAQGRGHDRARAIPAQRAGARDFRRGTALSPCRTSRRGHRSGGRRRGRPLAHRASVR